MFFPCTKQALPQPAQVAIFQEVKRHRALLVERVAALLADLAVHPQAKIRATFHLVYFCEQLGMTAANTGTGDHSLLQCGMSPHQFQALFCEQHGLTAANTLTSDHCLLL